MHRVQYSTDLLEPNNIGVPKTSMVYDFPRNILINLENTNQSIQKTKHDNTCAI